MWALSWSGAKAGLGASACHPNLNCPVIMTWRVHLLRRCQELLYNCTLLYLILWIQYSNPTYSCPVCQHQFCPGVLQEGQVVLDFFWLLRWGTAALGIPSREGSSSSTVQVMKRRCTQTLWDLFFLRIFSWSDFCITHKGTEALTLYLNAKYQKE